jgi:predicted nucleic acid-binding protein
MRLFLDANVLFTAAHNPSGKACFLLELAGEGHWVCLTSTLAVEEARRNLARKYPACLDNLDRLLRHVEMVPDRPSTDCPLALAEKDRPIFAAALEGGATHLLTGDRQHFGAWMNSPAKSCGVAVQSVSEFLAEVLQR